jgi:hypothetical protein
MLYNLKYGDEKIFQDQSSGSQTKAVGVLPPLPGGKAGFVWLGFAR